MHFHFLCSIPSYLILFTFSNPYFFSTFYVPHFLYIIFSCQLFPIIFLALLNVLALNSFSSLLPLLLHFTSTLPFGLPVLINFLPKHFQFYLAILYLSLLLPLYNSFLHSIFSHPLTHSFICNFLAKLFPNLYLPLYIF